MDEIAAILNEAADALEEARNLLAESAVLIKNLIPNGLTPQNDADITNWVDRVALWNDWVS